MPLLLKLKIEECRKLRPFPKALGKLQSLEGFDLTDVGIETVAVAASCGNGKSSFSVVLFPKLRKLMLDRLREWEETVVISATNSIMPNLQYLTIWGCKKLKAVPHYMFSPSLKDLTLSNCKRLTEGMQPSLPLQLESLTLVDKVGIFSESLLSVLVADNSSSYSNLKSFSINGSPHTSLPQGLNRFISLQFLRIIECDFLDLRPEEDLRHFPMLQSVDIDECPTVEERCKREDWTSTLSNIPYEITIDLEEITQHKK